MNQASRRLWLLLSPSLPVGGYSYSQGLEYAVANGQVTDFESTRHWIGGLARQVLPRVDLPLLLRMFQALANRNTIEFQQWNLQLLALRETAELRAEDLAMGQALWRLLGELTPAPTHDYPVDVSHTTDTNHSADISSLPQPSRLTFAGALACAGHLWALDEATLCDACAWIWCENQVAAAVKLVPLGHSDGQRLLLSLADELNALTVQALACPDEALGMTATGLAIASAQHENQAARLFRS